jgi:hypothetical protein
VEVVSSSTHVLRLIIKFVILHVASVHTFLHSVYAHKKVETTRMVGKQIELGATSNTRKMRGNNLDPSPASDKVITYF